MSEQSNIRWQVTDANGGVRIYSAPNCKVTDQGLLVIGDPNTPAAIFAPGRWVKVEDLRTAEDVPAADKRE